MAETLLQKKIRFAQLLQREPRDQRFARAPVIAKQVLGKDAELYPMYAIKVSEEWPFDDDVVAELDRLDSVPVGKDVALRDVYALASDKYREAKDRIAAYRLYSEMNGWTKAAKESGNSVNETLAALQALHNASTNPVDT